MSSPTTAPPPRCRRRRATRRARCSTPARGAPIPDVLAHGTTVATNALLERRLGRVALVTTRGFADVIEIARQARPSLYDAHVDRPAPLVPRELRFEVAGRLDAHGRELEPFDGVVPTTSDSPGSTRSRCACSTPTSIRRHERAVAAGAPRPQGIDVVCSHEVSPEFREYERMVTTVADAALARGVRARPWRGLERRRTRRAGDDVGRWARAAGRRGRAPGPAAAVGTGRRGPRRGRGRATRAGSPTRSRSTWAAPAPTCASCRAACPTRRDPRAWRGSRCGCPSLAIHTIGAGGGSVARLDPGGALVVGPESAGADPGLPATGGAAPRPPSPTPTSCSGGSRPTPSCPAFGRLDVDAAARRAGRAPA